MSSSLSRLLYRTFCTSSPSPTTPNPSPPPPLKHLLNQIFRERSLKNLVAKFKQSSEVYRFRCKHVVYEVAVRRLAAAKRFTSIEEILEHQKKYKDISNEGFAIRLISLYGKVGMFDHASKLFDELPELKCERTVKSFNVLLNACVDTKRFDKVEGLFKELPSKLEITPDEYSYNILVRAYCEMGSLDSAFSLLDEMEENNVKPNLITFNTILNAFYGNGRFSEGEEIWERMVEKNLVPDIRSYNCRLRGLIHEKKTDKVIEWLEEMKVKELKPDIYSFNALMKGFCQDGYLEKAIAIYDDLEKKDCVPIRPTYEMLVPAACEKGQFHLALKLSKESIKHRCYLDAEILQTVVNGLVEGTHVLEATKLVQLARSKRYGNGNVDIPRKKKLVVDDCPLVEDDSSSVEPTPEAPAASTCENS